MRVYQLDSYVLLLSGRDCLQFLDGLSTNKVDGTCTTVFTKTNAKIIDMVEVIIVGDNVALVGHNPYKNNLLTHLCLLYTSPSPRDGLLSRMPSSA